jgi:hypothetical protein
MIKFKYTERDKAFASFPAQNKLRFFKNVFGFLRSDKSEFSLNIMSEFHNELGEVFLNHYHPFHCGIVVIANPIVAETISFHQPDRSRTTFYQILSKFVGHDGSFLSSGKRMKSFTRTVKQTAFSHESIARVRT